MKNVAQRLIGLVTLVLFAALGLNGCQQGSERPGFRVGIPERGGLHNTQTIPVSVRAQPGTTVPLTMDPEDCGVLEPTSLTTDELGGARAVFTAGVVEQDCTVTVTGVLGSETSQATIYVHPPKVDAVVTPWTGSDPAPSIEIFPKVSPDDSASGTNRFEYFITQSSKTSIQSISMTFAADATVKVLSALGTDFRFADPAPSATSSDQQNWTLSEGGPFNSVTLEAVSESQTSGTATFDVTVEHSEGVSTLTLSPTGPKP
ncbi:hypothetical protein MYX82_06260 [Acidobacteria bacterium AH-259-D05]|nr:hypothetical protein [Acidobacteria bacterium AH-259-D05]